MSVNWETLTWRCDICKQEVKAAARTAPDSEVRA